METSSEIALRCFTLRFIFIHCLGGMQRRWRFHSPADSDLGIVSKPTSIVSEHQRQHRRHRCGKQRQQQSGRDMESELRRRIMRYDQPRQLGERRICNLHGSCGLAFAGCGHNHRNFRCRRNQIGVSFNHNYVGAGATDLCLVCDAAAFIYGDQHNHERRRIRQQ
jgi:hypothetical protein